MAAKAAKAFISCSLHPSDKGFVSFIERIVKLFGFVPFGTVGKYSAAPQSISAQMTQNIKKSDCLVVAATPRYKQLDLISKSESKSISEQIHTEIGIAVAHQIPVLVFVQKGTNVGRFIPSHVQYIEIDHCSQEDIQRKTRLITSYFANAKKTIQAKWNKEQKGKLLNVGKAALAVVGGATLIGLLLCDEEETDEEK